MADITTDPSIETAEARRKAMEAEYGTYVCVAEDGISINGARAFNTGDPVPVSHIEAYPDLLAQGLVEKRSTKAAEKATEKKAPEKT